MIRNQVESKDKILIALLFRCKAYIKFMLFTSFQGVKYISGKKRHISCIFTRCIALRWVDLTQVIKGTGSLQRLLIYQSAVFLPGHAVSSSMQAIGSCHNVVKEPICTLPWQPLALNQLTCLQIAVN